MNHDIFTYVSQNDKQDYTKYPTSSDNEKNELLINSQPIHKIYETSKYISYADKENNYHFHHGCNTVSDVETEFQPHFHPIHEIFIHIKGKAEFSVGTAIFRLNPYDIIIVPPYTIHKPIPLKHENFERCIINIFPDFFVSMDCCDYQNALLNMSLLKYKIPGHIITRSKIMDVIDFFTNTYDGSEYIKPLLRCKIAELMYHINTIDHFESFDTLNSVVQEIILYIDKNFESITNVQNVTDNFYYSKNYLSKIFKKSTGITIPRYINMKKMEKVEKLSKQGISLTRACIEAGFSSYNNFAYIYKTEFGIPPKKGIQTIKNGSAHH